jgi:hypothetical protein
MVGHKMWYYNQLNDVIDKNRGISKPVTRHNKKCESTIKITQKSIFDHKYTIHNIPLSHMDYICNKISNEIAD